MSPTTAVRKRSTTACSLHSLTSEFANSKMRYSFAASTLLGLAAALPQRINIDAALAVPTPSILGPKIEDTKPAEPTYNPIAAASAVAAVVESEGVIQKRDSLTVGKRDACDTQPLG
jgi:hypothetical protein